ncbi:hypothetical protein CC2G_012008 [Coprinopsis cinerea AmutBmut pab1-1]|nr:hypothetical protein CC2G_012008 [Coprinopsis cinerea AmutBmut pab1-1]
MLPRKFQPFIMNHMRRVYITPSEDQQRLVQENARLRNQVTTLQVYEEQILARSNQQLEQLAESQRKERDAGRLILKLESLVAELEKQFSVTGSTLERERDHLRARFEDMTEELDRTNEKVDRLRHERNKARALLDTVRQENDYRRDLEEVLTGELTQARREKKHWQREYEELSGELMRRVRHRTAAQSSSPATRSNPGVVNAVAGSSSLGTKRARNGDGLGIAGEADSRTSSSQPSKKQRLSQ